MQRLLDVMAQLRDPQRGCEWDLEQTFETIAPYTIEEAYEVADAIANNDVDGIREELGDLLFQVVFQSQVASDRRLFQFEDVAKTIADKMVHRHPHVFGDRQYSKAELNQHWEKAKADERNSKSGDAVSALDGVALALPALTRAEKIQKRASRVGFDWETLSPVLAKVDEELSELRALVQAQLAGETESASDLGALSTETRSADIDPIEDELGDVLFAVTNVARHLKIDPEQALRKATGKFERRFSFVEDAVRAQGSTMESCSEAELDILWRQAKQKSV